MIEELHLEKTETYIPEGYDPARYKIRHSAAHIMAQAVVECFSDAESTIVPQRRILSVIERKSCVDRQSLVADWEFRMETRLEPNPPFRIWRWYLMSRALRAKSSYS